jgi:hypothetical protein
VFAYGFWIVSGEREKFFDLGPVDQVSRTDDFNPKGNGEIRSGTFCSLLMVLSGKEVEGFCLETALGGGFTKTGLTKENGLTTFSDG